MILEDLHINKKISFRGMEGKIEQLPLVDGKIKVVVFFDKIKRVFFNLDEFLLEATSLFIPVIFEFNCENASEVKNKWIELLGQQNPDDFESLYRHNP